MHRFNRVTGVVGAAVLIAGVASGCSGRNHAGGSGLIPTGAYVQQPAATGESTVGYLDIRNNGSADTLTSVTTSVGGKVELRGPVSAGHSPIIMHTVPSIPLPAGETTQLIPNSFHLLISGAGPMHDGKDIQLTLRFAHGSPITVNALVTNPQNGGSSYFLN
ncbi:MAG TPA: copper chaperone PCu(A)C [Trebonia sp.]|nr:copper chaperone PCu(A)C [Trebonia sp.]